MQVYHSHSACTMMTSYLILYIEIFALPMTHAVLIIQFVKLYITFACQVINRRMLISLLFYVTYL